MADTESNSEETGAIFLRKVPVVICTSDTDSYELDESTTEQQESVTTKEQEQADDTELR